MNYIYTELSNFATVHYEDMERENDGSINIDDVNIVYNIDGQFKFTENEVRSDIPLIIDIWYPVGGIYEVEDMIYQIDKLFNRRVVRVNGKIFKVNRSENFVMNVPENEEELGRKRVNYSITYYNY